MINVAIYLRKSREDNEKENLEETLARHERMVKEYCYKQEFHILKIYKEVVSAEHINNRPQMLELLNDVKNKKYNGVVVIELERLSRGDIIDANTIYETFKKANTIIYDLKRSYNFNNEDRTIFFDPKDKKLYDIKMLYSSWEYEKIRSRLAQGKYESAKEGYYVSGKTPFGYKKERIGRGYVLIPDQNAYIVKEIFNRYVNLGESSADILKWLNELDIKYPHFKINRFENTRLNQILRNKVYIGYIKYQNKRYGIETYFKGKHEPLVDELTFNKAEEIIKSHFRPHLAKNKKASNPFAGILKCPICGRSIYYKRIISGDKTHEYLCCKTIGCKNFSIKLSEFEEMFIYDLKNKLKTNINDINSYLNIEKDIKRKEKQYNDDLIKYNNMLNKCYELLETNIYDVDTFFARKNYILNQIENVKMNIKNIEEDYSHKYEETKKMIEILRIVIYKYQKLLTPKYKNELLRKYISKMEYYKQEKDKKNSRSNTKINIKFKLV